jgi:hypothetical protein
MKNKRLVFALFFVAAFLAVGGPLAAFQGITIQKDITVAAGESQDNIFTLGGNAVVDGTVRQSVVAVGGTITVSGEVGDAVVAIGSRIVIKSTAVIKGDVVALGGTLEKEPGCTIQGDTVYIKGSEIGEKIFKGGLLKGIFSFSLIPVILIIQLISIFVWLMLALVGTALFPKPIALAAGELRKSFWLVFAIGFLVHIVFFGLVVFAALLSIILIGIPVLLALIAAAVIIKIFGRLVVFYFFGESLLRAFGSRNASAIGTVLMGLLVFSLIGFLPVIGFLFGLVMNMVGWGIAIRTKFGTTENMFQKKQPVLPVPPAA